MGEMKRKLDLKKTLAVKREPVEEDVLELMERLDPRDLRVFYFFLVGLLTTRGYEMVD